MIRNSVLVASALSMLACSGPATGTESDAGPPDAGPSGLPLLGNGAHTVDAVEVSELASALDALSIPRDLAFNPQAPDQLWIVNYDSSFVVVLRPGTPERSARKLDGDGNTHFLAQPSSLAFGAAGFLATAQEEDDVTQRSTPADFMGPSLWSADLRVNDGGWYGHMDMLHNSPNGAGIAWDHTGNAYWIFDGFHNAITRYDFQADHGPGGEDHSDGIIARYAQGAVRYVPEVGSHMELERETRRLFIADTGNNRIAVLDTASGTRGPNLEPNYDGCEQYAVNGASITTFVDGAMHGMQRPSGLAFFDRYVLVGDNATSRIYAFDRTSAELVDYLDLSSRVQPGGLMGLAVGPDNALVLTDSIGNRVLRVAPRL